MMEDRRAATHEAAGMSTPMESSQGSNANKSAVDDGKNSTSENVAPLLFEDAASWNQERGATNASTANANAAEVIALGTQQVCSGGEKDKRANKKKTGDSSNLPLSSKMPLTKTPSLALESTFSAANEEAATQKETRGGHGNTSSSQHSPANKDEPGKGIETAAGQTDKDLEVVISDLSTWRVYGADVDDAELKKAVKHHLERKNLKNELRVAENMKARASIADPSSPSTSRLTRRNSMGRLIERSTSHGDRGLKRRASLWQPSMRNTKNLEKLVIKPS